MTTLPLPATPFEQAGLSLKSAHSVLQMEMPWSARLANTHGVYTAIKVVLWHTVLNRLVPSDWPKRWRCKKMLRHCRAFRQPMPGTCHPGPDRCRHRRVRLRHGRSI